MLVTIPVSVGELIDKMIILQIKEAKLLAVNSELAEIVTHEIETLCKFLVGQKIPAWSGTKYAVNLRGINELLWDLESKVRSGDVNLEDFRLISELNDRRAEIKGFINVIYGSDIVEIKFYGDKKGS